MGVAVDTRSHDMQTRRERDHCLAMALLTKSRTLLRPETLRSRCDAAEHVTSSGSPREVVADCLSYSLSILSQRCRRLLVFVVEATEGHRFAHGGSFLYPRPPSSHLAMMQRRPPLAPTALSTSISLAPGAPALATTTTRRKRQAAALSTFAALQTGTAKRQCLAMADRRGVNLRGSNSSSSNDGGSDSAGMRARRERAMRGIARRGVTGRPRSVHFALQGLSSTDTRYLMQLLADLPHDIAQLNAAASRASRRRGSGDSLGSNDSDSSATAADATQSVTSRVFGWRNSFVVLPDEGSQDEDMSDQVARSAYEARVIWKAVKMFEATDMRRLATNVWDAAKTLQQTPATSHIAALDVLYTVSPSVRVVRCVESLYGRAAHETLWVECLLDRDDHICIGRKQLTRFRDYRLGQSSSAAAVHTIDEGSSSGDDAPVLDDVECEGFLFRPHLTRLSGGAAGDSAAAAGTFMLGCTLQRVRSIARREVSTAALVRHLIADLPRYTLQWEEAVVHDLLPQITY